MFLSVVVDRSFQAQLFVNGLIERLAEVGNLLDELDEFLQFQTEEYGGGDGAHGNCRFLLVEKIGFTEVFAVAQESYP